MTNKVKNKLLWIDEYRNNPEFYFFKGLRCANKKNIGGAYRHLAKAAALEPANSEYKFNMACFLSELQRPNEANRIFYDILLNYDPTLYDCYFGLGCNYLEIGEIEKAAENFDKYLYFDTEGEFEQEVFDMVFYLKLYNDVSHDNKFVELSASNLRRAKKNLRDGKRDIAVRELHRALKYNPLNIEARNLFTLFLLESKNYTRARQINQTVRIYGADVWAKCLWLYILSQEGKHSRANKVLEVLAIQEIDSREELFCIATALWVYHKVDKFIEFLERHILEYSDPMVYSALLLGYVVLGDTKRSQEVGSILKALALRNPDLESWLEHISKDEIEATGEYEKAFLANREPFHYAYFPGIYFDILKVKKTKRKKISPQHMPLFQYVMKHKEIVYGADYESEITEIINHGLSAEQGDKPEEISAVIEYIYCRKNDICMEKDELAAKYDVPIKSIDRILKKQKLLIK